MMQNNQITRRPVVIDVRGDEQKQQPIPLELRHVIKSVMSYGRQTHALGVMKAVSILTRIERDLSRYVTDHNAQELDCTLRELSSSIVRLRSMMSHEYNDEQT